jgi:hypothetical protein
MPGLVGRNLIFFFENDDPEIREARDRFEGGCQSNNAATDNQQVCGTIRQ